MSESGVLLDHHGKKHDVFVNPATGKKTTVPRHAELADTLCKLIKKQLEIEKK